VVDFQKVFAPRSFYESGQVVNSLSSFHCLPETPIVRVPTAGSPPPRINRVSLDFHPSMSPASPLQQCPTRLRPTAGRTGDKTFCLNFQYAFATAARAVK
jgi:hypothetical protein